MFRAFLFSFFHSPIQTLIIQLRFTFIHHIYAGNFFFPPRIFIKNETMSKITNGCVSKIWMNVFFSFSSLHETIVHEQDSNIEWTCSGLRCIANEMPNTWWEYLCVLEMFTNTKMPIECIATLIKYTHTHTQIYIPHFYIYMCVYGHYMCMCFGFRHRVDNVIVVICHHRFYLSHCVRFFGIAICFYTCIISLIIYVICTLEFQPIEIYYVQDWGFVLHFASTLIQLYIFF